MMLKIGVAILNYCGWKDTLACAESVLSGNVAPDWLVIVDNGSPDDSACRLRAWGQTRCASQEHGSATSGRLEFQEAWEDEPVSGKPPLLLLRRKSNGGYAAGNNAAIRLLLQWGADAVWLLNNDTLVDKNALTAMRDRLFSCEKPGLCGSLVCYMDSPNLVQCRGGGKTNWWTMLSRLNGKNLSRKAAEAASSEEVEGEINFIYGASVMASRSFLENVGLLNEKLFLYCEEQDWALRAKGKFDFAYAPNALVLHKEGATTGHSAGSFSAQRLAMLAKNRIRLAVMRKPLALPGVFCGIIYAALRVCLKKFSMPG